MDEHEVPTHVQAEDRVLLWFTFPQIVALTAVAALAYGVYHFIPVGAEAVRIVLALGFALVGIAMVAGKVNGRRLPAVAADLMRFGFGPRRFQGPPAQLVRSEPPAQPVKAGVGKDRLEPDAAITQHAAKGPGPVRRGARKLANLKRSSRPRTRGERMPFKPRDWFRKRDRKRQPKREFDEARQALARPRDECEAQEQKEHRSMRWPALLGAASALAVVASVAVCTPPSALADDGEQESWTSDEIEFDPPPLIPGRRLFIERLTVTREAATVVLKAAANLEVEARAFGGPDGREPKFQRDDTLGQGGRSSYLMPLDGPVPSFTFSWRDEHGQAGAISLSGNQLPYPLPDVSGEVCDLRLVRLSWRSGAIDGSVDSDCPSRLEEPVELETAAGHVNLSHTALLPAEVTQVTGTLTVSAGGRQSSAPLLADGATLFELATGAGREIFTVDLTAALTAHLTIELPPLVRLTLQPYRLERRTETVSLQRPGTGQYVSETVSWTDGEGNTSSHTVSAYLSIPSAIVQKQVTLEIEHEEHVRSQLVSRPALSKTRTEELSLGAGIGSDDNYRTLVVPDQEPERSASVQTRVSEDDLQDLLILLGGGLP
ncbi:MAG: hypothetical protein OXD50_01600 [Chloroflexi bacterium]|nr:hypothetical protein [Chloroflexota bacterium]